MTGPGATHSRTTYDNTPHFKGQGGGGQLGTHVQHRRGVHLHVMQFNQILLVIVTNAAIGLSSLTFLLFTGDNKYNKTNSTAVSDASCLIAIALFSPSSLQYLSSMMVDPIHLHCRGNLIPRMFSFCE